MMFQIFLNHFFRDVARAPCSVPYRPEVTPPVLLLEGREFLLQETRRAPFEPFHQIRDCFRWWILEVHVDVVFAHHPFEYSDIFGVTDLDD